MRIALDYFPEPLAFENQTAIVLALENKTVFRRVINAFLEDCADEVLTFSQEWKPFAFSKQGLYIANLLQPDADAKKLMNHVASAMEQILNTELAEPLALVHQDLLQLGDALTARFDYDVACQDDLEAAAVVKLLQFRLRREESTAAERLARFLILTSRYLKVRIFAISNLYLYFESEEVSRLLHTLSLHQIRILDLECQAPACIDVRAKLYVLDRDLCTLDNSVSP